MGQFAFIIDGIDKAIGHQQITRTRIIGTNRKSQCQSQEKTDIQDFIFAQLLVGPVRDFARIDRDILFQTRVSVLKFERIIFEKTVADKAAID